MLFNAEADQAVGAAMAKEKRLPRYGTAEEDAYYAEVQGECLEDQAAAHFLSYHYGGASIPGNLWPGGSKLNGAVHENSFSVGCAEKGALVGATALCLNAEFSGVQLARSDALLLAQDAEKWDLMAQRVGRQHVGFWEVTGMQPELRHLWERFTGELLRVRAERRAADAASARKRPRSPA